MRFNFGLVMAEIERWPKTTVIALTALAIVMVVVPGALSERLGGVDVAVAVAGYSIGILGMKGLMGLMAYPSLRRAPFPGSYLVAVCIVFIPIFAFYAAAFHLLSFEVDKPLPLIALIPFGLFSYVLFSLFFAGVLHANEWMHKDRIRAPVDGT